MSAKFEQNLNDRKLGHEWYGWDGNIDAHEAFIQEPKRLFMGVVFFTFSLSFAFAGLLVWLADPRLSSMHPALSAAAHGVLFSYAAAFGVLYGAVSLTLLTKRWNVLAGFVVHHMFRVFPMFAKVAEGMGITKDRLGYSLVEIHNEMTRAQLRQKSNGRILCLAPRCIDRESVEQAKAMIAEYDCDFYMAPTGAQARQKIVQLKPAAIIGIACERDLVTGIRDVGYRIPVIGVTNKRPLGPCKGAFINLQELREAIETFKERYDLSGEATEEGKAILKDDEAPAAAPAAAVAAQQ